MLFILEVIQKENPEISCPELLRILLRMHCIVRKPPGYIFQVTRIQFIFGRLDSCSWWPDLIGEDCHLGLLVIMECIKKCLRHWLAVVIWSENCHKPKVWSIRHKFSLDSLTSLNCFQPFFSGCLCCPHRNTGASWSSGPSAHLFSFYVLLLDTFFPS